MFPPYEIQVFYDHNEMRLSFAAYNINGGCITFPVKNLDLAQLNNLEPIVKECVNIVHDYMRSIDERFTARYEVEIDYIEHIKPKVESRLDKHALKLRRILPGVKEYAECPVCFGGTSLWTIIIHLNDDHKWKRNEIADWLDTLDIDLNFIGKE